jgi:hypothetical protein
MTDYKALNWESIDFVSEYMYQGLIEPLNTAIDQLESIKNPSAELQEHIKQNTDEVHRHLARMRSQISAWKVLAQWKKASELEDDDYQLLTREQFPNWFYDHLSQMAVVKFEQTRYLKVHPDAFYQATLRLVNVARSVGKLSHIMLNDAAPPRVGIWLRIVFEPPDEVPYPSKLAVLDKLNRGLNGDSLQFTISEDLFELNRSRVSLQNNTRTGHQAFAVLLPIAGQKTDETGGQTSEAKPAEINTTDNGEKTLMNRPPLTGVATGNKSTPAGSEEDKTAVVSSESGEKQSSTESGDDKDE